MSAPDAEDLRALLERVEKASYLGSDLLWDVIEGVAPELNVRMVVGDDLSFRARLVQFINAQAWECAALALVERCLPGWFVAVAGPWKWADHTPRAGQRFWCAAVADCPEESGVGYHEINDLENKGALPALAILAALLQALIAQETEHA